MKNSNYNTEQILDIFAKNPEIESVIITSDGNCFLPKHLSYAKNHAMEFKLTYETLSKSQFIADLENEANTGNEGSEAKSGDEDSEANNGNEGSEANTGEEGSEAKSGDEASKSDASKIDDSWKELSFTEILEFAESKDLTPKTPKNKGKAALVTEVELLLSQAQK